MSQETEGLKGLAAREGMPPEPERTDKPDIMLAIWSVVSAYPRCAECKRDKPCLIKNCARTPLHNLVDGFKG